jgi:drug/metabolite transporter (DMT)-like permease
LTRIQNKPFWAKLGLLFITVIWGSAFVVVKDVTSTVPPSYTILIRFGITAACLSLIFFKRLRGIRRTELLGGLVIGIFNVLGYELQTYGLQKTTAGNSAFLTAVYCVIVPFLYWIVRKKKPGTYNLISAFLCIAGVGLLSLKSGLSMNSGDLLSLLCGLSYAMQIVAIDIFTEKGDPILLTVTQSIVTVVLVLPIALRFETFPTSVGTGTVLSLLYVALFSTMLAFLLQIICQKYVVPAQASLIMSLESVFGVICGIIFLHESMTVRTFFGCVLIFTAIYLSERQPNRGILKNASNENTVE